MKKLGEIVLAKFLEQFLEKYFATRRNLSAKSLREIINLPREFIVQGDYDLVRFASILKTEKK